MNKTKKKRLVNDITVYCQEKMKSSDSKSKSKGALLQTVFASFAAVALSSSATPDKGSAWDAY
jgi:hypothetical protein